MLLNRRQCFINTMGKITDQERVIHCPWISESSVCTYVVYQNWESIFTLTGTCYTFTIMWEAYSKTSFLCCG